MSEGKRIKELREEILDLNQEDFGAKIHRGKSTISQIENGKQPVEPSLRQSICHVFNVREEWLLNGNGEMFNNKTYEQNSGNKKEAVLIKEEIDGYPLQDNKLSNAVKMCIDVMESGTSYADALFHNLVHFDRAVKSEISHNKCEKDLADVNKTLSEMRTRMDEVEETNKKMKEELIEIRKHSGDSAPIALSMDHAAPTGTDDKET